ncbi:MAG: pilus assembly protein CpaE [Psychromonas sp.]|jgi:pilus assembly protein CpaE|uniref:AAA family ATPase n=1 Tax=Psychromonas sp. TaxID=1884585 RepID=UPI0039E6436F
MERNTLKIASILKEPAEVSSSIAKDPLKFSLPFGVNSLLVCADPSRREQVRGCLKSVKNLMLKIEPKITFIETDIKMVFLVYCGDEQQICADMEKSAAQNIPALLIGNDISSSLMRKAMQYQVKDFIPLDHFSEEIGPALLLLTEQISANIKMAPVVSIINGKGGSGSSFITDCLGHICAEQTHDNIALYDGDFQHGTLADMFGAEPEYFITDALKDIQELDALAIKSIMCSNGNLSLMPVKPYSHISDIDTLNSNDLSLLINKIRSSYQLVIADLSRGLDAHSLPIVDISDVVLVVVQQNIVSIRKAKELVSQMKIRLGIKPERIHLVVNRFSSKHSTINVEEIKKAVGIESAFVIHNNYELASACTDLGRSIQQANNPKKIKTDFEQIVSKLFPISIKKSAGSTSFWSRFSLNSHKE